LKTYYDLLLESTAQQNNIWPLTIEKYLENAIEVGSDLFSNVFIISDNDVGKFVYKQLKNNQDIRQKLLIEALMMHITNNHPNILTVYFTNQSGYACEFTEFGSLKNVIQLQKQHGYFKSPNAQENEDLNYWRIKFALDIALGMAHLHDYTKVLHNDLNSSNIMITLVETEYAQEWYVPVAKISDFGISSTPLLNKTDNKQLKSYYSILPPECLQTSSTLQQKSEVFFIRRYFVGNANFMPTYF